MNKHQNFEKRLQKVVDSISYDDDELLEEAYKKTVKDLKLKGFYNVFEDGGYKKVFTKGETSLNRIKMDANTLISLGYNLDTLNNKSNLAEKVCCILDEIYLNNLCSITKINNPTF